MKLPGAAHFVSHFEAQPGSDVQVPFKPLLVSGSLASHWPK